MQLYTIGLQHYSNKLHLRRFLENFQNFRNQSFFLKSSFVLKVYMKIKIAKIDHVLLLSD